MCRPAGIIPGLLALRQQALRQEDTCLDARIRSKSANRDALRVVSGIDEDAMRLRASSASL